MGLEQIVNVQISRQTAGVTQAGFGVPLILGPNADFTGEIRRYSSLAAVAEDFTTSDTEYVMAQKMFSQTPRPPVVKIGKRSTAVAQVVTFTPDVTLQAIQDFEVTIDGELYSFTSDATPTAAEVVTGLIALVNGDAEAKVTATGSGTLIITADNAGEPFTYEEGALMAGVLTTPSNGIADDIADSIDLDKDWYFLLTTATDDTTVKVGAATIEALEKIYMFLNSDADVITNVDTDLVSELVDSNYFRTAVMYTETPADRHESAFVGRVAPLDPGSETWANKTLAGVTTDDFTDSEQGNLDDKNANYFIEIAGLSVTRNGKVVGGEYLDVIRFIDWLTARIREGVFQDMVSNDKIPYTDAGIAVVENRLRSVLESGIRVGGISEYVVAVPKSADISAEDKAARTLTGVTFTAVLSGAIHAVEITGEVTL